MSKPWKPGRETVALPSEPRPSRIRRDPVRLDAKAVKPPPTREREIWTAIAGVVLIAAGCTALIVGVSAVTSSDSSAAAAPSAADQFTFCRTGAEPNCVIDGDTAVIAGERLEIAGMDAPEVRGAGCPAESRRGIQAAVRLRELLNGGTVAVTGTERGADGRLLRKVEVDARSVGLTMTAAGLARDYGGGLKSWC